MKVKIDDIVQQMEKEGMFLIGAVEKVIQDAGPFAWMPVLCTGFDIAVHEYRLDWREELVTMMTLISTTNSGIGDLISAMTEGEHGGESEQIS